MAGNVLVKLVLSCASDRQSWSGYPCVWSLFSKNARSHGGRRLLGWTSRVRGRLAISFPVPYTARILGAAQSSVL